MTQQTQQAEYKRPQRPLYRELASLIQAIANCERMNNSEWFDKHSAELARLVRNHLPHGSGIDSGCEIDLQRSNQTKLVINTSFHHMNENGFYDGWTEHTVTIRPSFDGIDITISGRNRNDIKDYLHEMFDYALRKMID